jgi:hypothetical protein
MIGRFTPAAKLQPDFIFLNLDQTGIKINFAGKYIYPIDRSKAYKIKFS